VNRSCEKLGCNEPAEVAFGIDRAACVVWLETYDADEPRHLNRLCGDHAARLTLPRGWTFDDRRERSPRLFVAPRPAEAKAKTAAKVMPIAQAPRSASARPANKAKNKPSRTSSSNTTSIPRRTSRDASAPIKRYDGPRLFDPTLPIGSPKLDASFVRDVTSEVVRDVAPTIEHAGGDNTASTDAQTAADAQYAPKFDRTSDVGGALKATGRLLSRAFSSQTKPIERPSVPDATSGQRRASDTDSLPQGDHIDDFHQGDHVE
jgi:hypothetical protein